jgi:hypothetical protein
VAGQVENMEPDETDPEYDQLVEAFQKACLAGHVAGDDALFSDVACLMPAKLKEQEETLVYVSCMASHTVRSYNPVTSTCIALVRLIFFFERARIMVDLGSCCQVLRRPCPS